MTTTDPRVNPYSCDGKRAYHSFTDAKKFATLTQRDTARLMQPYPCRVCGLFHVGSSEPHDTRVRKRRPKYEPTIESNLTDWGIDPHTI